MKEQSLYPLARTQKYYFWTLGGYIVYFFPINPSRPDPGHRQKINLKVLFSLFFGAFIKPFEAKLIFTLIHLSEMQGARGINSFMI